MGIVDIWRDRVHKHYGERWFAKGECSLTYLLEFLDNTVEKAYILTGELDSFLYNREDFISKTEDALKRNAQLYFVFHKSDSDKEAIKMLYKENYRIVHLKKEYPHTLHLYWQKRRSNVHFATFDDKHISVEGPHEAHKSKEILLKKNSILLAKRWSKRFEDLISECKEISYKDIIEN